MAYFFGVSDVEVEAGDCVGENFFVDEFGADLFVVVCDATVLFGREISNG